MIMKHWLVRIALIISIIGVFLTGCIGSKPATIPPSIFTPSPEQMDKSPFTGIPCAAPCWHGLEVGKSTEKDVTSILPALTFIDQKSVQIFRRPSMPDYYIKLYGPGVEIVTNCINSEKECLELTTANDILQKIIVRLNYEIRVEEAIGYLGNPDYIGYDNIGSERVICEVYLVWSESRLVLASRFEGVEGSDAVEKYCYVVRDTGKIPSNLPILEARYLSNAELNAKLSTGTGEFFELSGKLPDK